MFIVGWLDDHECYNISGIFSTRIKADLFNDWQAKQDSGKDEIFEIEVDKLLESKSNWTSNELQLGRHNKQCFVCGDSLEGELLRVKHNEGHGDQQTECTHTVHKKCGESMRGHWNITILDAEQFQETVKS